MSNVERFLRSREQQGLSPTVTDERVLRTVAAVIEKAVART